MNFLIDFLSSLYFFLPAYLANMTSPILKKIDFFDFLAQPVDFNKKFLGKPIFGSHKTWRGVIFSFLVGFFTIFLQKFLFRYSFIKTISILDYSTINIFLFGFLISTGAIFGDLFFAFVKRRLDLQPGAPFLPFDQTNYVIGAWIFLNPFFKIDGRVWLILFCTTFFLHVIINRLGYLLKIHQAKW